jgi:glycosyltransferase involved in cell wall biosynthesis
VSLNFVSSQPVLTYGKFFSRAGRKFFFKAVRPEPSSHGLDLDQSLKLYNRLKELKEAHTTGLVVAEAEAAPMLDLAAKAGLFAMVEISVEPAEILKSGRFRALKSRLAAAVNTLRPSAALLGYLLDCPIGSDALRDYGLERVRRHLQTLVKVIKRCDGGHLVALKHRPSTRALALIEEDFIYALMPPLGPTELRKYVVSLHNMAEARPVVIEFPNVEPGQNELVECAFGAGAAGVVALPMPVPFSPRMAGIEAFAAGELLPFLTLNGSCPPTVPATPMVSVVICAYNAERTMRECLVSLRGLDYPNYEVIIVDDGSSDRTAEIAMDFPEFRLIRQPNKGLSEARNAGLHAALGEIIAYTDSDCVVDPHWLTFMVRAMGEEGFDACGGPNHAPHEEGRIEACVAASPGAPCHVLTGEDRAEHLAGCNMAFTKAALAAVGGFDPRFTAAGDDVDICWRMLAAGYVLGFSPAAFVWHFRRNTMKAYYRQQRGYGRAEAMLYAKYAERFNALGQIRWRGTIPGLARTVPGGNRKRVIWRRESDRIQPVYEPALDILKFIPQTLEWNLACALALAGSYALGWPIVPALAMLALGPIWAFHYAWHAPLEKCHESLGSRFLVAMLAYTGPIARTMARYRSRLASGGEPLDAPARQRPVINWPRRCLRLEYWNEAYITRTSLIDRLMKLFARTNYPVLADNGWNDFDLEIRPNSWTRVQIKTADEEHEGMRLRNLVLTRVRLGAPSRIALAAGVTGAVAALALGLPAFALGLAAVTMAGAVLAANEMVEAGRLAYRAIEQCAQELALAPLGKAASPRRSRIRGAVAPATGTYAPPNSPTAE